VWRENSKKILRLVDGNFLFPGGDFAESNRVGLSAFSLVVANLLFFWALGIYIRVREGWAIGWAVWSGAAMLAPAGWEVMYPETVDAWSGGGPALLAITAWIVAGVHFWLSRDRPNLRGTGVMFLLQGLMAAGAAAAVVLVSWPLRF